MANAEAGRNYKPRKTSPEGRGCSPGGGVDDRLTRQIRAEARTKTMHPVETDQPWRRAAGTFRRQGRVSSPATLWEECGQGRYGPKAGQDRE
ncbi:hypothetical protein NDU88_002684 [Pleurodeles waltl]|uniref:Uncharacterized protein n=1 Tax=Pleurodeles waltl TaxID=8319 RepID=A0AAV7TNB4_PLEWA|nr:hypothetical protein NDU88_002684 [Pleurodeles waltl]